MNESSNKAIVFKITKKAANELANYFRELEADSNAYKAKMDKIKSNHQTGVRR